ncbi:sugar translocase [Cellulomonas sp. WB94]|uniref:GtrA family protein n=1 Tax=Cellulomonas sp. WB94 TaxID=2173174 RepID=UPI000D587FCB|nr:GtrA family protein [Cellulomonas sp. WB94]PVU82108.1 sugar translocase [Cellulomonas sp. WB94]
MSASKAPRTAILRDRLVRMARHQVGRFASVGVVNTLVDLGVFLVLTRLGLGVLAANTISTTLGMAVSFVGNRRFVFGRTGHPVREATLFFVVCAIGIWIIQPITILAVADLLDQILPVGHTIGLVAGKCTGIVVAAVWNFVMYKNVVFRAGTSDPALTAPRQGNHTKGKL